MARLRSGLLITHKVIVEIHVVLVSLKIEIHIYENK